MTVFESALFILSAAKAIQYLINSEFRTQTPNLAYILVRDSMIYFGSVLVLILINLIIWKAGRVSASRPDTYSEYGIDNLPCRDISMSSHHYSQPFLRKRITFPLSTSYMFAECSDVPEPSLLFIRSLVVAC